MDADSEALDALRRFQSGLIASSTNCSLDTLPSAEAIKLAETAIHDQLPEQGTNICDAIRNLEDVSKGLNGSSQNPNYYGFVTGGATPVASVADHLASFYDQNVQVHLPSETVATTLEFKTLQMLCELLQLDPATFKHRTFTTGATASNILGLACARESVIAKAAAKTGRTVSTGKSGIIAAMRQAEVDEIQVLTSVPHSSLGKAASIVGLGRESVHSVASADKAHKIEYEKLETLLRRPRTASIVAISCGEVNTGFFATSGEEMKRIRSLCDEVGAFIHVDGAFGLMARCLIGHREGGNRMEELKDIMEGVEGLEYADSITGDGHKLLNVPYDCGFFFSRSLDLATDVFQNAGAAYLNTSSSSGDGPYIPSPLNIGLENSRRFRALPVYASLVAYGRSGYADMLLRQIEFARAVSRLIASSEHYQLLPQNQHQANDFRDVYIVVLFRAIDDELNAELVKRINQTRRIYVSGTAWEGRPAARIAVSNWQTKAERDVPIVQAVLKEVHEHWASARPP